MDKLFCPMSFNHGGLAEYCVEEKCAWWNVTEGKHFAYEACAILSIAQNTAKGEGQ